MEEEGNETNKKKDRRKLSEGVEIIVDEARAAASEAYRRSGVESLGEGIKQAVQGALSARENVVMVRLNKEAVSRLDELVDSDLVNSRSEAAAFLIGEGIKSRAEIFDRMAEKIGEIRRVKAELRELLDEPPAKPPAGPDDAADDGK